MSSLVVVLDACVLFPASLRDTLLRTADAGLYQMQWTNDILEEVQRNFVGNLNVSETNAQQLIDTMREHFPEALVTHHTPLIKAMPDDSKNRHVLVAAVACQAKVIVTQNLRRFSREVLSSFKLEAQSADEFLTDLFYLYPERLVEIVAEQAADLCNPSYTMQKLLKILAHHAPTFASLVASYIDVWE
jgi:predicted nucleic acid-binding protein